MTGQLKFVCGFLIPLNVSRPKRMDKTFSKRLKASGKLRKHLVVLCASTNVSYFFFFLSKKITVKKYFQ